MNRESSSRMSKRVRAGLVAAAACMSVAAMSGNAAAFAAGADSGGAPSLRVNYAGLDLTSDQGARILYQRIETAAERVCETGGSRDLRATLASRLCERKAIAAAIEQVGNPKLAALLAASTERS